MVSDQTTRYSEARKAVERQRSLRTFLAHLGLYLLSNVFFGAWNALTYYVKENQFIWFPLPLLFWGVGLIIHYWVSIVLFDRWWERDEAEIARRQGAS